MRFSFIVLGLWVLHQWWRYLYFGDLLPNTAHAQSISVFGNLRPWLPDYDIAAIRTGQWTPGEGQVWEGSFATAGQTDDRKAAP